MSRPISSSSSSILSSSSSCLKWWSRRATWQKCMAMGVAGYALSALYDQYKDRQRSFSNEVVVITGAASGLGRLLAMSLSAAGCRTLILWDIHQDALDELIVELREKEDEMTEEDRGDDRGHFVRRGYVVDVTDRSRVYEVASEVENEFGPVDVLINNAGIVTGKTFLKCADSMMEKTMHVNALSHLWTLKAFLPGMLARNSGQVVTVASMAGICASAGLLDYCASKYAAVGIAEALGMELRRLGKTGVSSVCVCPFYIKTGMFEGAKSRFEWLLPILEPEYVTKRIIQAMKRNTPMVIMPWFCTTAPLLKSLLPASAAMAVTDFLGMNNAMDDFVQTRQN